MPETLFGLLNLLPLPVWGAMILFPRARFTQRLVTAPWLFLVLCGIYAVLLAAAVLTGGGAASLEFDALRGMLASEWGFLAGWAHYLAFDLFVGVWIFRDAKYWGAGPWLALPLLLTLLAGPLGLGAYLLWRRRRERLDPVRTLN